MITDPFLLVGVGGALGFVYGVLALGTPVLRRSDLHRFLPVGGTAALAYSLLRGAYGVAHPWWTLTRSGPLVAFFLLVVVGAYVRAAADRAAWADFFRRDVEEMREPVGPPHAAEKGALTLPDGHRGTNIAGMLGALAIIGASVFGAQTYADRYAALRVQSDHLRTVLADPANLSVCQYAERLTAIYQAGLLARQQDAERVAGGGARPLRTYLYADVRRVDGIRGQLADLQAHHCQDIRSLTLTTGPDPTPVVTFSLAPDRRRHGGENAP